MNDVKAVSKNEKERELIKKLKKELDEMKFSSSVDQVTTFLENFEEFIKSRGISKTQIDLRRIKKR